MSLRHLKRLQREKAEREEPVETGSESEEEAPVSARGNLFAFLSEDEQVEMPSFDEESDITSTEESDVEIPVVDSETVVANNFDKKDTREDDDWDSLNYDHDKEKLIKNQVTWNTVNLDSLEESKEVKERTGSVNGQLKRPLGKIIAPRKNWPKMPAAALGFTVARLGDHEYRIIATEGYIEKFHALQVIISSADVAALSLFNKDYPEVVEGYLLLSDIIRQHSVADAAVMTEIALYYLEKAMPLGFSWSHCSFKYDDYPDNRSIHLSLFRHIQFLLRRASWTTALECAKILYNIDKQDPLLAVLFIDYILYETRNVFSHDQLVADLGDDCRYPFLRYTSALLHKRFDDGRLNIAEAADVLYKKEYTENYTHAVFKLYFGRTASAWKNVRLPNIDLRPNDCSLATTDRLLAVYRHGLLSDQQNIHLAYPSSSTLSLDPFPPTSDGMEYLTRVRSNQSGIIGMLRRAFLG